MKFYSIIILVACVAFACAQKAEFDAKAAEISKKCVASIPGMKEEELATMKDPDLSKVTKNVKCFLDCFNKETGFVKDGVPQEDVINQVFAAYPGHNPEKLKAAFAKCKDAAGDGTDCDKAFNLFKCFRENGKA